MDLKYALEASEEFGKIIWPIRKDLRVNQLVLYGSVSRAEPTPTDVDLLVIHRNQKFDLFQNKLRAGEFHSDAEALKSLEGSLGINLTARLSQSKVRILISQGLFHTAYINEFYFTDQSYKKRWDQQNRPGFSRSIISEGVMWNKKTEHYDIPAKKRYSVN